MSYFKNLLKIPFLFWIFYSNSRKQKIFMQSNILKDLSVAELENDESINARDFQKIRKYYGHSVAAIPGEGFALLRELKMTDNERYTLTYLGGLTGLFDDFFDEKNTNYDHILDMIDNPNEVIPANSHEKLFLNFWKKASGNTLNINLLKHYFHIVNDCQQLSKKQENENLTREEIREITFKKGGNSILFYRVAFGNFTDDAEQQMLYNLGCVGQLENDIFDIYKDYKSGIRTMATTSKNMEDLRLEYVELVYKTIDLVKMTSYGTKGQNKFIDYISLIMARGMVCLQCLYELSDSMPNQFQIEKYNRKDLICNMETLKSRMLLIHYFCKLKR